MRLLKRFGKYPGIRLFRLPGGFALTEVVIAIAVLALIIATVTPVLVLITHYRFSWNEQRVAENLARNHIEYIKVQPYVPGPSPSYRPPPTPSGLDGSWDVTVEAVPVILRTDPTGNETESIEIDVKRSDMELIDTIHAKQAEIVSKRIKEQIENIGIYNRTLSEKRRLQQSPFCGFFAYPREDCKLIILLFVPDYMLFVV